MELKMSNNPSFLSAFKLALANPSTNARRLVALAIQRNTPPDVDKSVPSAQIGIFGDGILIGLDASAAHLYAFNSKQVVSVPGLLYSMENNGLSPGVDILRASFGKSHSMLQNSHCLIRAIVKDSRRPCAHRPTI